MFSPISFFVGYQAFSRSRSQYRPYFSQALVSLCLLLCLVAAVGCATKQNFSTPTVEQQGEPAASVLLPNSGVLLAVFGTSEPEALKAYQAIAESYAELKVPVVWAYTSNIIRAKMLKAGTRLATPHEALEELVRKGVRNLRVQSLHLASGEEYTQLDRGIYAWLLRHPGSFESVCMGRPLLESERDVEEVVAAALGALPAERKPREAVLFMGHGHEHGRADLPLFAASYVFNRQDPLAFLATVEGSLDFERALARIKASGVRHVWLAPFMMVAGDHARNDLAGNEPNSWASRLKAEGMTVTPVLQGLGEIEGVRAVLLRHTLETKDDFLQVKGVN